MVRFFPSLIVLAGSALLSTAAFAQFRTDAQIDTLPAQQAAPAATKITLQQALEIALSENVSVKVADKEIERKQYARKGTYASLFPQIDLTGSYQRTIKKQVMYMDMDMSKLMGGAGLPGAGDGTGDGQNPGEGTGDGSGEGAGDGAQTPTMPSMGDGGIEVGRFNTYAGGVNAAMPIINPQLWMGIKLSADEVELAVEKARSSRLETVTAVKNAYYAVLLSKEVLNVYVDVYNNAVINLKRTEMRYNVQKASELDYQRAKSEVANAIPNVYNSESTVILALWQLKAVMGVDLDMDIDVDGALTDYSDMMFRDIHENDGEINLDYNSTMRQLAIQAEELAKNVKIQKYAYIPTLGAAFSYQYTTMQNHFRFSEYRWTPYSYVGLSLNIPIFSGGKRLNEVRQAKVQKASLDMTIKDTERKLKIGVRQNLQTMETNMKSYNAAESAVATAQKAYNIAQKSYEVGKSTITELNAAQLGLTQAKLASSQAIYNFVTAKASLEQILGHDFITEDGNVDFDMPLSY